MTDQPLGPGWWQASNGKYYPPEAALDWQPPSAASTAGPWSTTGFPHGPYAYGAVPPRQGTNGLAIASLVCSLLGFCTCVSAPVGIVLGHIALTQLGRPDNTQEGRGLAIGGLVVGYVFLAACTAWIALLVVAG